MLKDAKQRLKRFDTRLAMWIERVPGSWLPFFRFLAIIAHPVSIGVLLATTVATLYVYGLNIMYLATILFVLPLATLIKLAFRRKRPETIYASTMRIKSYSFPSSHAYTSMLFALAIITSVWTLFADAVGVLVGIVLIIFAIAVAVSRVRLGAHHPSDVLGGALLAAVIWLALTGPR